VKVIVNLGEKNIDIDNNIDTDKRPRHDTLSS